MRGNARARAVGARGARTSVGGIRRLRAHPRGPRRGLRPRRPRARGAARGRHRRVAAAAARRGARGAARRGAPRPAEPRQRERAAPGRGQRRAARRVPRRRRSRRSSTSGSSSTTRASTCCSTRCARRRRAHRRRGLRRLPRRARGDGAAADALHRAARAPPPRPSARARGRHGRAVDLPRGVRDGRCRGSRSRLASARRAPLRSRRDRGRARGGVPGAPARSGELQTGDAADLAAKLQRLLALSRPREHGARARARASALAVERWSWAGVVAAPPARRRFD